MFAKFLIIVTNQGNHIIGFSSSPNNPDISLQRIGTQASAWGIDGYQQENGIYVLQCKITIEEGQWNLTEGTWSQATPKNMEDFGLPLAGVS